LIKYPGANKKNSNSVYQIANLDSNVFFYFISIEKSSINKRVDRLETFSVKETRKRKEIVCVREREKRRRRRKKGKKKREEKKENTPAIVSFLITPSFLLSVRSILDVRICP